MIDKLKDKILLSEELSKHLKLRKKGDLYWACCPFHEEKTPSFVINNEKKFFYCFGCGESGDIFGFYKKFLNRPFFDTVKELSQSYGIKIPVKFNAKDDCQEILNFALDEYKNNLKNNISAIKYLKNRGLTDEVIEKFQLGFAKESDIINSLINKGFKLEDIKKSGINSYGGLDRFRNRIIFPIFSKSNKVIGFSGRVLDDSEPKYINSSESDIFQKNLHLFNENNLEPKIPIILVEGYLDVISLYQHGIKNVVASMGTALSQGQVFTAFKNSNILYLMFDNDKAGKLATERSIEICSKLLTVDNQVFVCNLTQIKDPDSLVQLLINDKIPVKEGIDVVINSSKSLIEWQWNKFLKIFDKTPASLAKIFDNIEKFLINIQNKSVRMAYKTFLDNEIFNLKKRLGKNITSPSNTISAEDIVINIILKIPDLIDQIIEDLMLCQFTNKIYEKIRNDIIEKITIENMQSNDVIAFILIKYDKSLEDLLNHQNFSYIISNRGFALQYLIDTMCILKRGNVSSLETV